MRSPKQGSGQRIGTHPSPFPMQLGVNGFPECKPSQGMPHSGPLVQREPGGRCLLTGSNWSKTCCSLVVLGPSLQRLQEGCHSAWWPQGTGGHTATSGVFLKPKDSGREEGEPQGTALPPADAEQSTPQQAVTSQGDYRWGDNRFSTFLLGQQEDKSLYFLFCSFVCESAELKDQPATL